MARRTRIPVAFIKRREARCTVCGELAVAREPGQPPRCAVHRRPPASSRQSDSTMSKVLLPRSEAADELFAQLVAMLDDLGVQAAPTVAAQLITTIGASRWQTRDALFAQALEGRLLGDA